MPENRLLLGAATPYREAGFGPSEAVPLIPGRVKREMKRMKLVSIDIGSPWLIGFSLPLANLIPQHSGLTAQGLERGPS